MKFGATPFQFDIVFFVSSLRIHSENVPLGNVGLAVIITNNAEHRVILYRTKQDILSTFALSGSKWIYIRNDYVQYHDDAAQFWSVRFASDTDRDEFLAAVQDRCSIQKDSVEDGVTEKEKPHPIAEPVRSSSAESTLIDRMAKMGRQILPTRIVAGRAVSSDSDDTDPEQQQRTTQIVASRWKPDVPSRSLLTKPSPPPVLSANNALIAYNHPIQAMTSDPEIVSLFTEHRFQNAEVRMCLSKLESKIERVLDKVDFIREANNSSTKPKSDLEEDIIRLEERLLELKKENRQLRLNREAGDSHTAKALSVEKQRNALLEERLESQRAEMEELRKSIATKETEIQRMDSVRQQIEAESKTQSVEQQSRIDDLTNAHVLTNDSMSMLKASIADLERDKLELEEQLSQFESARRSSSGMEMGTVIKDIMNAMYQSIQATVSQRSEWSAEDVLKLMRTVIKRETMNVLSDNPNSYN